MKLSVSHIAGRNFNALLFIVLWQFMEVWGPLFEHTSQSPATAFQPESGLDSNPGHVVFTLFHLCSGLLLDHCPDSVFDSKSLWRIKGIYGRFSNFKASRHVSIKQNPKSSHFHHCCLTAGVRCWSWYAALGFHRRHPSRPPSSVQKVCLHHLFLFRGHIMSSVI